MRIVEVSDGEVAEAVRADHADTRNLAAGGAGAVARMAERERMAAGGSA